MLDIVIGDCNKLTICPFVQNYYMARRMNIFRRKRNNGLSKY